MRLDSNREFVFLFLMLVCVTFTSCKAIKGYCNKELCFLNRTEFMQYIIDVGNKNISEIFDIVSVDNDKPRDRNKHSEINYLDGLIANINNDNNITENHLRDAGTIAAWVLILMIVAPCILIMSIFVLCCQYVFHWCKPRRHIYREYEPPLLIRPQPYPRYNPSSNFNA